MSYEDDYLADAFAPHVYIGARKVAETLDARGLKALKRLTISWGANDWYSNVDPAELKLGFLDPFGEFLDITAEDGLTIRVTRDHPTLGPEAVTMYEGVIVAASAELITITDARSGTQQQVWHISATARDMLHLLAQDRRRGPRYYARPTPGSGSPDLHWGPCRMVQRKRDVDQRTFVPIDWEPTALDVADTGTVVIMPVPGYETQQTVSLLTILRNTARISDVMNRPYYDPRTRRIRFMRPSTVQGGTYLNGATVTSMAIGTLHLLKGREFSPAGERIAFSTGAVEQITRLEMNQRSDTLTNGVVGTVETATAVNIVRTAPAESTFSVDTDFGYGYDMPASVTATAELIIAAVYGRQTTGPLQWMPAAIKSPSDWSDLVDMADMLLSPFPPLQGTTMRRFALVGSLTNWAPTTGHFSIVGGEISFTEKGWNVTVNPAPVREYVPEFGDYTLGMNPSTARLDAAPPHQLVTDLMRLTGP